MRLDEVEIDLQQLVAEVMQLIRPRAAESDVRLLAEIPSNLPPLLADETKLKQILLNLLSNSVKFTPKSGSVTITARLDPDGCTELCVRDTGIGMDEREIALARSRFGQVESLLTRRHAGVGLGLPLAISLIELHGGTFDIRSMKGKGTRAIVRLPKERTLRQVECQA